MSVGWRLTISRVNMQDPNTVSEVSIGTKYGAPFFVVSQRPTDRETIAAALIMLCSTSWVGLLIATGQAVTTIPWCTTLLFISALALLHTLRLRLSKVGNGASKTAVGLASFDFIEACALSYFLLSLSIGVWLLYHHLHKDEPLLVKRQVVDIQLTSLSDFSNQHELLPNSKNLPVLRQQNSAAKITQQGTLASRFPLHERMLTVCANGKRVATTDGAANTQPKRVQSASTSMLAEPRFVIAQPQTGQFSHSESKPLQANSVPMLAEPRFVISQPQSDHVLHNELNKTSQKTNSSTEKTRQRKIFQPKSNGIFLEELSPLEMVELVDNQGDTSLELWQPGGRSSGGAGSRSLIVEYLKDLHKRIKKAWAPRAGENRSAEILFRIRHDGRLSSLKLMRSSGDASADESIMHAITSSSPFKPLPSDYAPEYIDLQYTFNYKVDRLTEITESWTR